MLRAASGKCRAAAVAAFGAALLSACADPYVTNPGQEFVGRGWRISTRGGPGWQKSSVGEWMIETQADRITARPAASAYLETRQASTTDVDFMQTATLGLSCMGEYPVVRVGFDFKIGTTRQSIFGYRFDLKPGRETDARVTPDHTIVVLEDPNEIITFTNELATAKTLYVRIHSLNAPRATAQFNVEGAREAIAAVFSQCPPGRVLSEPKRTSAL